MKLNKKLMGLMLALTIGGALVGCSSERAPEQDTIVETPATDVEDQEDASDDIAKEEGSQLEETQPEEETKEKVEEEKKEESKPEADKPATKPEAKPENNKPATKPETSKPVAKPESKPDANKPVTKPETKPEASKPEAKPETKPEVTTMSASELMNKVITDSMEMPGMMNMDSSFFADTYGIDPSILKSYEVRMPMMMVHATEVAVFELNNASDAGKVTAGIEKRVAGLKSQWESYLPEQLELVQNYKIATKGNYVILAISEHRDTIISNFNAQVK